MFQHTAARRRLMPETAPIYDGISFNTQPPEGGWYRDCIRRAREVSTHSRPKAAGKSLRPIFKP